MSSNKITPKNISNILKNHLVTNDYDSIIKITEEYIVRYPKSIPVIVYYYYGRALFVKGRIETGREMFAKAKTTCGPYLKVNMARILCQFDFYAESMPYLEEAISNPEYDNDFGYFLLGKNEYYFGNNSRALELLEQGLKLAKDPITIERFTQVISKIKRSSCNRVTRISLDYYLQNGHKIEPGVVVYLKNNLEHPISNFDKLKAFNREYIIFYADDEYFYAFPITSNPEKSFYNLPIFEGKDKYVFPKLAFFKADDIDVVVNEGKTLYSRFIKSYYQSLCMRRSESRTIEDNFFLGIFSLNKNIMPQDVIVVNDPYSKSFRYYLILDINDSYTCAELYLNNGALSYTGYQVTLPPDTIIFERLLLTEELKTQLLNTMPELIPAESRN